jgi:acetolactate synthase-1/2/3 large subunit
MAGMHGEAYANKALTEADLIVSLGSRFDDRLTGPTDKFRQHAKIVHIDVDPVEINKTVPTDFSIVGDLRDVVPALTPFIEARDLSAWLARIQEWRGESVERDILTQETDELVPQYVIRQLWEATQGKVIVVSDVGQNRWGRPNTTITNCSVGC